MVDFESFCFSCTSRRVWFMGQIWPDVFIVLFEHSHTHFFLYYLCMLLCYNGS